MTNKRLIFAALVMPALLNACSLFNPYNEESQCIAKKDFGDCVSVPEAYETVKNRGSTASGDTDPGENKDEISYRRQLYREMATLLEDPRTPMLKPPKIRRILITSYDDKDVLYMPRYVYVIIDKGGWVLDEVSGEKAKHDGIQLFKNLEK